MHGSSCRLVAFVQDPLYHLYSIRHTASIGMFQSASKVPRYRDQVRGNGTKDSNGNIDDLSTRGWNTTARNLIDQAPRISRRSNIEPAIVDENAIFESVEVADTDIAAKEDGFIAMLCSRSTKSSSGRTRSRRLGVVRSSRKEEAAPLSRTDPGRKKKGSCFRPRMGYHIALCRVANVR